MIETARNRINSGSSAVLYSATGIGAAILVIGVIIVAAAKPATATPAYARKRSWLVAGATQVQPAAGRLPILAKTLPRTGTNYPRNSSQREAAFNSSADYGGGKRRRDGSFDALYLGLGVSPASICFISFGRPFVRM